MYGGNVSLDDSDDLDRLDVPAPPPLLFLDFLFLFVFVDVFIVCLNSLNCFYCF